MRFSVFAYNSKHKMIYIYDKDNNYVSRLQVNHSASTLQDKFASLPDIDTLGEAQQYAIDNEFITLGD